MENTLVEALELSFVSLGNAFRDNPFDFLKENDVTCFLYNELKQAFPDRVPVALADGIERFNAFDDSQRMTCARVHTEISYRNQNDVCRFDLVVLEDREQLIHPKSNEMMGSFEPPFQIGIEVKLANGSRSTRFCGVASGGGLVQDIAKLACLHGVFSSCYVVVVDFYEERRLSELRKKVAMLKSVGLFYVGLDRYEMILP